MTACIGVALLFRTAVSPAQKKISADTAPASKQEIQSSTPATPLKITLKDAIKRARALSPTFQLAATNAKVAAETPTQTFSSNLPTVSSNTQYLYTQGNGTPVARYIANNGVHEYIAQVDAHEAVSIANIILYRKSLRGSALAHDQAEIARRGLVVTVVLAYSTLVAAKDKYQTTEESTDAAQNFLKTTQQLQTGGEVARADVVKAQVQYDNSRIALQDALQAREIARVQLAAMLFPDVNQNFDVVEDPAATLTLPDLGDVETAARHNNPSLDAAIQADKMSVDAVHAARAEYLPTMTLDYFYGIDANHFATETPSDPRIDPELHGRPIQNLGYSALASLTLPIWNWGATRSRVKSAEILEHQADVDLKYAQRKLVADLRTFYGEAKVAQQELAIRRTAAANAAESQKLTLLQYKAGDATALEVVSAQDALTLQRNAFADAETRYAVALANLSTLTGTL